MQPVARQPEQTVVVLSVANARQQMEFAIKRRVFGLGIAGVVMGILCFIIGVVALYFNTETHRRTVTSVGEGIWGGVFEVMWRMSNMTVKNVLNKDQGEAFAP